MSNQDEPAIEEMRAAWETLKANRAKATLHQRRYLETHPEQRERANARSKATYANLRRLAKLAKEAGLG